VTVPGFLPVEGSVVGFTASAASSPKLVALHLGASGGIPDTVSRLGRVAEHPLTPFLSFPLSHFVSPPHGSEL
jgi:hypothetical protein